MADRLIIIAVISPVKSISVTNTIPKYYVT